MKIIICGAGKVGLTIARQLLINTENDITVIDYDENRLNDAKNLDLKTIYGFSSSPEILDRAGAMYAEMIICVTLSDEINMLTAHIAGTMFNVELKIARIRSTMYLSGKWSSHIYNKNVLGIDHIVFPELEVAKHVMNMLYNVGLESKIPFYRNNYNLISIAINNFFSNKSVKDVIHKMNDSDIDDFSIKFIKRANTIHFVHNKTFTLEKGDEIFILCKNKDISDIVRCIHGNISSLKKVLICGGGEIGFNIAKLLEEEYFDVKILEIDQERCQFLSEKLPSSVVICGNMHDRDIIKECGQIDAVISVSGRDEVNIFTTLIAQSLKIPECFTLIDEYSYPDVFYSLNLKNIINTRDITISKILNCIGGKYFTAQKTICNGLYNICEFIVHKHSDIVGMEYSKFDAIKMHILGIIRDENLQTTGFEKGGKFIEGDVVLVVLPYQHTHKLEQFLAFD